MDLKSTGMLSPYRVLDLTDEKGLMCGKLLADLGAEVIKIEKPGGDSARRIGPFYQNDPDPEKSLFWFAYNTGKKSITLDIEKTKGQALLKRLVSMADFLIESSAPGFMERLGLGYDELSVLNPRIIMVSITPFGQTGPYAHYKSPDIVAWAMGGSAYYYGEIERPPVRVSHHSQAFLHAGSAAAAAAMFALHYRKLTGEGQHVDISIQECVAWMLEWNLMTWDASKTLLTRKNRRGIRNLKITSMWPCRDGYVIFYYGGGAGTQRRNQPFLEWMESVGAGDEFLRNLKWDELDFRMITAETIAQIETPIKRFFQSQTREEIYAGALKYRVMLYPVSDIAEIADNPQLKAREFWVKVPHPELNDSLTYPGGFLRSDIAPPVVSVPAPQIGEHNRDIYTFELGLTRAELNSLKAARVI